MSNSLGASKLLDNVALKEITGALTAEKDEYLDRLTRLLSTLTVDSSSTRACFRPIKTHL